MGVFDYLLSQLNKAADMQDRINNSYNETNNRNLSNMSSQELARAGQEAVNRKDYGAAKAYSDELKKRKQ